MYDGVIPAELKFEAVMYDERHADPNSLVTFPYLNLLFLNEGSLQLPSPSEKIFKLEKQKQYLLFALHP